MTQRTKLELPLNQPITVSLLYDEPVSGNGKYGAYHLYAVAVDDDEYSFFASEEVHDQIKSLRRGDSFTITKLASQRGNKVVTTHEVKLIGKEVKVIAESTDERDMPPAPHDNYYSLMLQSYRDAIEINRELNGMIDIEKASISLFIARSKQSNY